MTGHRPFRELTKILSPERKLRIAAKAAVLSEAMSLEQLREARALTQEDVVGALDIGQPAVAKAEQRSDMHVSSLRRYIEALGGSLELTAKFPDATVVLTEIGDGAPPLR